MNKKHNIIVANPPFSAEWNIDNAINQERFEGGHAPKKRADFAFIQHMIDKAKDDATIAVVVPHGVLFRSNAEQKIRTYLIKEKNYLDAVIGLPSNLFFGTSIPTSILVFKKCREEDDNVLFIDASQSFEKGKNQNHLTTEDVEKIVETYKNREALDKYSYAASLKEIAENDYNLNIPRYVDTFEEEEPVDLDQVQQELNQIDNNIQDIEQEINSYLKELGVYKHD